MVIGVGNVGRIIIKDLLEYGHNIDGVLAVDINIDSLKRVASEIKDPRLETTRGDIRDIDMMASLMKRVDVVVNSAWYEYNLHAIKAAVKAGRDLADLGGLYWMTKKELGMDDEVKGAGVTVLIGVGDDPGTSNVLAAYGSGKMDSVEEIHIRWGSHSESGSTPFGFSVLTVLDEATMPAILYINGRLVEASPLSYPETTYFPEPIGYRKTYAIIHSELATLPYTIRGVKTITYKDTWDESFFPILSFMRNLGLTSRRAIKLGDCEVVPQKIVAILSKPSEPRDIIGCLKVELRGYIGGESGRLVYYVGPVSYNERWDAGVTAYTTGVGASIGVQLLGEGGVSRRGVVPPELIDDPYRWISELARRGIAVVEERISIEEIK